MICVTPAIMLSDEPPSSSSSAEALSSSMKELSLVTGNITTGFIMDGVTDLLRWCEEQTLSMCRSLEYVKDPVYYSFDHDIYGYEDDVGRKDGGTLEIQVSVSNKQVWVSDCTYMNVVKVICEWTSQYMDVWLYEVTIMQCKKGASCGN